MRPQTAKPKLATNEYTKEIEFLKQQKLIAYGGDPSNLPQIFQKNPAFLVLDELQAELFNARCHDTGETVSIERAKIFKEEFNKINSKKFPDVLNLYSMRLGVTTLIALANQKPIQTTINLADNTLGDYAVHAIKTLLANSQIKNLNLASNMISHIGLGQIIDDLCKNQTLKSLDLGVLDGSIRKNALGFEGAKHIAQLLLSNKKIETLKLQDNVITTAGGEFIGQALKTNQNIKHLKIAENDLKIAGIETILLNGQNLESLDLSKNNIRPTIKFQEYLMNNRTLKRLNLEFNDLGPKGVEYLANGIIQQQSGLVSLNLKGNQIRDEGIQVLSAAIYESESLQELDISLNDITPDGIRYLADVLPNSQIKILNLSKNLLGDESMIMLCNNRIMEKLDVSSSRVADQGFMTFLTFIGESTNFTHLKANDNYISEKVEKLILEIIEKNQVIIDLQVTGNRLSLCCLNRIQKILLRNQKILEEKEPSKIRTEIYRLKYEQKKIQIAKDKLSQQEKEILQIEDKKSQVIVEMERIKQQEQSKRAGLQERITDLLNQIEKKKKIIEDKQADFERSKQLKQQELDAQRNDYQVVYQKRKELEQEFERLQKELDAQEQKFKDEQFKLEDAIADKKAKGEDIEKQTAQLREELMKLQKQQFEQNNQAEKEQQIQQQQQVINEKEEKAENDKQPEQVNKNNEKLKPKKTTKKGKKKK
ncbi:unnamed protein product [Paramecium primaurelia]|uniref:Leucine Rich Repeat family protein n=1 Tax=Paramecium primaurelia TaxID=5886 RepID=A0A8S1JQK5_PARPR|nr:unnamed protein product [Paramecium primaurelia]